MDEEEKIDLGTASERDIKTKKVPSAENFVKVISEYLTKLRTKFEETLPKCENKNDQITFAEILGDIKGLEYNVKKMASRF